MGQTPPPAMDEALGQADQVPNVKTTPKEGLLHALFAIHQGGPVDKAIGEAHARRQAEAQLHQRNMNTIAAKLHYDEKMSKDPSSMTTVMEGGVTPGSGYTPLTEDEKTKLRHQYDISEQLFNKAAGVDKPTKAHAGAISTVLRHIVHRGAGQPQKQGGPTPPPADDTQGGGTPQQGAPFQSITESSKPTPPPSGPSDMAMLPFERADIIRQQGLKDYTDREKVLYDLKTKEDEAKAKAQAEAKKATTGSARPAVIAGISARKAKFLAASGKKYKDLDDNEINVAELPDSMGLKSFTVKMPDGHWEMRYEPFSPNQKQLTAGNQTWTINPMDVEGLATDEGTYLGEHIVPSTTATRDPATGQTTVAQRTPTMPGIPGRTGAATPQGTTPAVTPAAPAARKPSPPPTGAAGAGKPASGAPSAKAAGPADYLAADGHIDPQKAVGKKWRGGTVTPQIVEIANRLIDDEDVEKLGAQGKGLIDLGSAFAREATGGKWFRGRWSPAEISRVNQTEYFLEGLKQSDALKVLDSSAWNRYWVGKATEEKHKGTGITASPAADFENFLIAKSAKALTPQEAEFNRMITQLGNVAAGMSTLTRGNRPTNSTVTSIRAEMPNVLNAKDSKDAKARIDLLLQEIKNAKKLGWEGKGSAGPTPPPAASGTAGGSDLDTEIMNAVKAAKPH